MTLEQKVAQLFVVSPETLTGVDSVQYAGDMPIRLYRIIRWAVLCLRRIILILQASSVR